LLQAIDGRLVGADGGLSPASTAFWAVVAAVVRSSISCCVTAPTPMPTKRFAVLRASSRSAWSCTRVDLLCASVPRAWLSCWSTSGASISAMSLPAVTWSPMST
jgi:hypothetical protein